MTAPFKPGDLVVITGGGCNQPKPELMAIWTIDQLTPEHAIVIFNPDIQVTRLDPLPRKRYPFNWLALYKRGSTDEEDEEF